MRKSQNTPRWPLFLSAFGLILMVVAMIGGSLGWFPKSSSELDPNVLIFSQFVILVTVFLSVWQTYRMKAAYDQLLAEYERLRAVERALRRSRTVDEGKRATVRRLLREPPPFYETYIRSSPQRPRKKRVLRVPVMAGSTSAISEVDDQSTIDKFPGVCGGSAVIIGTRIPVWQLAEARNLGVSDDDLLLDYPRLSPDNLSDAWRYIDEHPEEIEAELRRNEVE